MRGALQVQGCRHMVAQFNTFRLTLGDRIGQIHFFFGKFKGCVNIDHQSC